MKKITVLLLLMSQMLMLKAQDASPKLVVGIMVDQMKQEYIWRFKSDFGNAGFNRLLNDGFTAQNAHYNYSATSTGPGHASVYTGTTPSIHGIVDNVWYSRELKRTVYCAEDTIAVAVGGTEASGKISPRNLYSSTITDELKLSTQHHGKVISMSIKDRGAALPGGHYADGAYWYDHITGDFMTSSYYVEKLPEWVTAFNAQKLPDHYLNQTWETSKPIDEYTESGSDNSPFEWGFKGKDTPTFPYDLASLRNTNGNFRMLPFTPYGNTILNELAIAAIDGEGLGEDDITDFLSINYSSPDYIGHNFGPQSKEVHDTYVKLDLEIERLLKTLDDKVGANNYIVFLTADHGVAENSIRMNNDQFKSDNIRRSELNAFIDEAMIKKYGEDEWFEGPRGYDQFLNHETLHKHNLDLYEVQLFVAQELMKFKGVYLALTATDLARQSYTDPIRSLIQNCYHPKESGDLKTILDPGWQAGGIKGTGHGNAWSYDTHVPIIFYGWGVNKGRSARQMHITDIAPTVSMILQIRLPSGSTGAPILEAIK